MFFLLKKAQSISEYVLLLALLASVFVAMQVYVKRGLQGRLRDTSDYLVRSVNQGLGTSHPNQYEPNYRSLEKNTTQDSVVLEQMFTGGVTRKDFLNDTTRVNQTEVIR